MDTTKMNRQWDMVKNNIFIHGLEDMDVQMISNGKDGQFNHGVYPLSWLLVTGESIIFRRFGTRALRRTIKFYAPHGDYIGRIEDGSVLIFDEDLSVSIKWLILSLIGHEKSIPADYAWHEIHEDVSGYFSGTKTDRQWKLLTYAFFGGGYGARQLFDFEAAEQIVGSLLYRIGYYHKYDSEPIGYPFANTH